MTQTDLILLILIGLSVLIGVNRGFCSEFLRVIVYVFSGVLGYMLLPVFLPAFAFIPLEAVQKCCAIFLGTFVAWIVLKILMSSLISAVRKSCLNKLDRSLGGVFGSIRAGVFLIITAVCLAFFSPETVRCSRVLTLSYAGCSKIFKKLPDLDAVGQKIKNEEGSDQETDEPAQPQSWKERLLYGLQNTTVDTKDGEKKLISAISSILARSASKEMLQNTLASDVQESINSSEEYERMLAFICERQIEAWLKGVSANKEEMHEALIGRLKDNMLKNEHSGD